MFQSYIFHINGLLAGGNGYSMVIDPAGQILHRGNVQEEMIPIEVDFELVRRQRRNGILNMGQPHKSFRDCAVDFPVYQPGFDRTYLDSLGPLQKPGRPTGPNVVTTLPEAPTKKKQTEDWLMGAESTCEPS